MIHFKFKTVISGLAALGLLSCAINAQALESSPALLQCPPVTEVQSVIQNYIDNPGTPSDFLSSVSGFTTRWKFDPGVLPGKGQNFKINSFINMFINSDANGSAMCSYMTTFTYPSPMYITQPQSAIPSGPYKGVPVDSRVKWNGNVCGSGYPADTCKATPANN